MKKFIAIIMALCAMLPAAVKAENVPTMPGYIDATDAETITSGVAEVVISYDLPTTVHALTFCIAYLPALSVESVTFSGEIHDVDTNLAYWHDTPTSGEIAVGVLCAGEGIWGRGELMTVRFRVADYYSHGTLPVYIISIDALHDEIGGASYPVTVYSQFPAEIHVHRPTTEDVLTIVRYLHFGGACQAWYDVTEDGAVTLGDALALLRRVMGVI